MNSHDEREDCTFYIPSLDMYGRKDGDWGLCSNRNKFVDKKHDFSIYDHTTCWTLNPKIFSDGCNKCNFYNHNNIINQKIYLIKRILRTTGLSNPFAWGWFLKQLIFPRKKCECEDKHNMED